jgi:diguanylate cyclase (GGDEF)-like protein
VPITAENPTVLVVEDSPTARAVLRKSLVAHGFAVTEAFDGEEALSQARATTFDVILLDVEMPKLDGYQVISELKADPELQSIPVVFLTGRETVEDVAKGLRLGAHDYLRKPFEEIELVARVRAAARMKSLQDELRQRHAALLEISRRDGLTGLFNRRYLEEQLFVMASSAARHGQSLAAIMVDIDHFKRVNDTHGHAAGDAVLCAVAERLRTRLRLEDLIGRWGGEEFLILLAQTEAAEAATLAEALRQRVGSSPIEAGGAKVTVTVSLGCAAALDRDFEKLIRRADAALYEAKSAGRNAVRMVE